MVTLNQVISAAALGQLRYTPDSDFHGDITIQFRVSDGKDLSPNPNILTITVQSVNDTPAFFFSETIEMNEDFVEPIIYAPFPASPENESFETVVYSIDPLASDLVDFSFDPATGMIEFSAVQDAEGTTSFVLTADDGNSENNIFSQEFFVTIYPVNDAPLIEPIADAEFEQDEDIAITIPVSDVDNEISELQITAVSDNQTLISDANIGISFAGNDYTLSIMPTADLTGDADITIAVSDGETTVEQQFTISIVPITGIEDIVVGKIETYPNPADDIVRVRFNERGMLTFLDALGAKVRELPVRDGEQSIGVSGFVPGVYLMRMVTVEGKVYIGKLIRK
jgi:hypothetical protein